MSKHPRDVTGEELLALRAMTIARRPVAHSFADDAGRIWNITPGMGEHGSGSARATTWSGEPSPTSLALVSAGDGGVRPRISSEGLAR